MRVVNISDPENPEEVGYYDTPGGAVGVAVSGDYAYVADGYSGLCSVNISDPENPSEVDSYDTDGNARGVFVGGEVAYIADLANGLLTFDVGDYVAPAPDINLTYDIHDFGDVQTDDTAEWTFTIENIGDADLEVTSVVSELDVFTTNFADGGIIGANGSREVIVTFNPAEIDDYFGTLTIASNDNDEAEVDITLTGAGVRAYHYDLIETFGPTHLVIVAEALLQGEELVEPDEVAVFRAGDESIYGLGQVDDDLWPIINVYGMPVEDGGDDIGPNDAGDGFEDGEEMLFKFWDASAEQEIDAFTDGGRVYFDASGEGESPVILTDAVIAGDHFRYPYDDNPDNVYPMIIQSAVIDGNDLAVGDEIGAFDPEDNCGGASDPIDNDTEFPISFDTYGGNGDFSIGEAISLKIWDADTETDYEGHIDWFDGRVATWGDDDAIGIVAKVFAYSDEAGPHLGASRYAFEFGDVVAYDVDRGLSEDMTLTITNTGYFGALNITDVSISGDNADDFSHDIVNPEGGFAIDASEEFTLTFAPGDVGARSATLVISSNDPVNEGVIEIPLSGTGIDPDPPVLTLTNVTEVEGNFSRDFGDVLPNEHGTWTFQVSNDGYADLVVDSYAIDGEGFNTNAEGDTYARDDDPVDVTVTFDPEAHGAFEATLTITSNDGGNDNTQTEIILTGNANGPEVGTYQGEDAVANVTFDPTIGGTPVEETVTIMNDGDQALTVSADGGLTTTGSAFSVGQLGADQTLAAGESFDATLTFDPDNGVNDYTGTLRITSNDPIGVVVLNLEGTHREFTEPEISADFSDLEGGYFGVVTIGEFRIFPLTITNSGESALVVGSIVSNNEAFTIQYNGGDVNDVTISGESSDDFNVTFTPTGEEDAEFAATLSINSNDEDNTPLEIAVSGDGRVARIPDIQSTASEVQFETTYVGEQDVQTLLIRNTGNTDLEITGLSIVDNEAGVFSFAPPFDAEFTIGEAESHQVTFTFDPASDVEYNYTFEIESNDPDLDGPFEVTLTGLGDFTPPAMTLSALMYDFGTGMINETVNWVLEISNTGHDPLVVSSITMESGGNTFAADFEGEFTVETDAIEEVTVSFTPPDRGEYLETMIIASNDGAEEALTDISLEGIGAYPEVDLSTVTIAFGQVTVNNESAETLTISNLGDYELTVSNIVLEGANSGLFNTNWQGEQTIAVQGNYNLEVTYTPDSRGDHSAVLTVSSDDPNNQEVEISLSGFGREIVIGVDPEAMDFGEIDVETELRQVIEISNSGNVELTIEDISFNNDAFREDVDYAVFDWEFDDYFRDYKPIIVSSATLDDEELADDDYIGVFTPDDLCAGYSQWSEREGDEEQLAINAWEDDPDEEGINGFRTGEQIYYRFYDSSAGREYSADAEYSDIFENSGEFQRDELSLVTLTASSNFAPRGINELPITIDADGVFNLSVFFSPEVHGDYDGIMTLQSNATNDPSLEVQVSGVALATPADLILTNVTDDGEGNFSRDFGDVLPNEHGTWTFQVSNDGYADLVVDSYAIDGEGFNTNAEGDTYARDDDPVDVTVTFDPEAHGAFEATLTITSNDGGNDNTQTEIILTGNANGPEVGTYQGEDAVANVTFDPTIGGTPVEETVTIMNDGDQALTVSADGGLTTTGSAFSVGQLGADQTLAAGESFDATLTFDPDNGVNDYTGTLRITSNDPIGVVVLNLEGTHREFTEPEISADFSDLEGGYFGVVTIGEFRIFPLTITNSGESALVVGSIVSNNEAFTIQYNGGDVNDVTISGESSDDFNVTFTPTGEEDAEFAATLSINSNDEDNTPLEIAVSGDGRVARIPDIQSTASEVQFETTYVGEQDVQTLLIRNTGNTDLEITGLSIVDNEAGVFSFAPPFDAEFTIGEAESHQVTFTFDPASDVEYNYTFEIESNDPDLDGPFEVTLTGLGDFTPPAMTLSALMYDFGTGMINETVNWVLEISNTGHDPLVVSSITMESGGNTFAADFEGEFTVETDAIEEVTVSFTPPDRGEYLETMIIASNDGAEEALTDISLEGIGAYPEIGFSGIAIDFGNVQFGQSGSQTLIVTNDGDYALTVSGVELSGDDAAQYSTDWNGEQTLAIGASYYVEVTFEPEERGDQTATLTVSSNDPENQEVEIGLTGFGLEIVIEVSPDAIEFGEVRIGNELRREIQISNTGNAPLIIEQVSFDEEVFWEDVDFVFEFDWAFDETGTSDAIVVASVSLNGDDLVDEDYVGVFTTDGICAGFGQWSEREDNQLGFLAYGDDPLTPGINGFVADEVINFRIWDYSAGREYDADAEYIFGGEQFGGDFAMVSLTAGGEMAPMALDEPIEIEAGNSFNLSVFFGPDQVGDIEGTMTLSSNANNDPEFGVTVTGTGANTPPEVDQIIDPVTVDEDCGSYDIADLDEIFSDPNEDELTFTFSGAPDELNMTINNETHILSITPDDNYNLEDGADITLTATDPSDASANTEFGLVVRPVNDPVELTGQAIGDVIVDEDSGQTDIVDMDEIVTDIDGWEFTFTYQNAPDELNMVVNEDDHHLYINPDHNYNTGAVQITLIIEDEGGVSVQRSFSVTVNAVIDGPVVAEPIDDMTVWEDQGPFEVADLDEVFNDIDGGGLTYNFTQPANIGLTLDDENVLSFNPTENYYNEEGVAVMVFATDDELNSATDFFIITINPLNDVPVIRTPIDDVTINEDSGIQTVADLDNTFRDYDGERLEFSFSGDPEEFNMLLGEGNVLTFETDLNYNNVDGAEISVTAQEPSGQSVTETFLVVITPVNDNPTVAEAIADVIVDEDPGRVNVADLDLVFIDVDGDELTFTKIGDPGELNMAVDEDNVLYFNPEENYSNEGVNIAITADDGNATITSIFSVTINSINDAPFVENSIDDIEIEEDPQNIIQIADLDEVFNDPDGDQMTYEFSGDTDELNMSFDQFNILLFDPDMNYNHPNGIVITVSADDGNGEVVEEEFEIVIIPVNDNPYVAVGIDDANIDEDSGPQTLGDLDQVFADVDLLDMNPDELSFSFDPVVSGLNMIITDENVLEFSADDNFNLDETEITVTAEDNGNLTISETFNVTVEFINDAPFVVDPGIDDITVDEDSARITVGNVTEIFGDVDLIYGDNLSYSATVESEGINLRIDGFNMFYITLEEDFNVAEGAEVTLTATDDSDESVDAIFILTVVPVNDAPTVVGEGIGNVTRNEDFDDGGTMEIIDLDDAFNDVDDDDLTFTFTGDTEELNMVITEENILEFTPDENYNLPAGVTIVVTADDGQATVDEEFILRLNSVNDRPTIVDGQDIEDITVGEDSGTTFIANLNNVFTDVEDDQLEFIWSGGEDELNITLNDQNLMYFRPDDNFNLPGGVEVTVRATDSYPTSVSTTFIIVVSAVNDEPFVENEIEDFNADEDSGFSEVADLNNIFSDIDTYDATDPDELTFSFEGATDELNMEIDELGVLSIAPDENYNLEEGVEITVTADDGEVTTEDTFTLILNPVNDAPTVANELVEVTVDEDPDDGTVADLNEVFSDVDIIEGDELRFLPVGAPDELRLSVVDGILIADPVENYNNIDGVEITIVCSDLENETAEDVFTLYIAPTNDPPHVENLIEDASVPEDSNPTEIADLDDVFSDIDFPDGDELHFAVGASPENIQISIGPGNMVIVFPNDDYNTPAGGVDVTVTAIDEGDAETDYTFSLVISPVNDDPINVAEIENQTFVEDAGLSDIVDLDDYFDDIDLADPEDHVDILTYSVTDAPEQLNLTIDDENMLKINSRLNYNTIDGVNVTITATDQGDATAEASFTIIITPVNDAPEIVNRIQFKEYEEDDGRNQIADLDNVFTDIDFPDDDNLTYSFVNAPDEINMEIVDGHLLIIDPNEHFNLGITSAEITVIAEDDSGETAENEFLLRINPVNDEPFVANPIENQEFGEDSGEHILGDLDDVFDDVDIIDDYNPDALTFEFSGAPDELNMVLSDENELSYNAVEDYNLPDGAEITLTAIDNNDAFIETSFILTITLAPAEIVVSDAEKDFGEVTVYESSDWSFNISNIGSEVLNISDISIDGEYFSIDFEGEANLARYDDMDVLVTFEPENFGDFNATVTIYSDDEDESEVEVALTGQGVMAVIEADPEALAFGGVMQGVSSQRVITITNGGNIDLDISDITTNPEQYTFDVGVEEREFDWNFDITDVSMSLLLLDYTYDGEELEDDDYVGVFTPGGVCGGYIEVSEANDQGNLGFPAWADEQGGNINGFRDGEELEFRYWDTSAGREFIADAEYHQGDGTFTANTLTVATLSVDRGFNPMELDPHVILGSGEQAEITVTFLPDAQEEFNGTLVIFSNALDDPELEIELTGSGLNVAPEVVREIDPMNINEDPGETVVIDLDDVFIDPDDDVMIYTLSDSPEQIHLDINEDNELYFHPDDDFNLIGGVQVEVTATDDDDATAVVEFALSILPVNDTPTVEAPFDDVVTEEDHGRFDVAVLDEVFADVDMNDAVDPDALSFSVAGGPDELNLDIDEDNMLFFHSSEDFILPDGAEITVTAADNFEASVDHVFTITITPVNDGPVVENEIADTVVDEDAGLTIIVDLDDVFTDIDFDELSFTFEGAPDEFRMDIDDENNLFIESDENYNLVNGAEITVTAADADEESVSDSFTLIITPVNDEPFVVAENEIADITIEEDAPEATIIGDLDDVFDDVDIYDAEDADWLDFSHDAPDELNMEISEENVLSFHADEDYYIADGMFITITAQDQRNRRIRDRFELTITPSPAEIEVSELDHNFGDITIGEAPEWSFTVSNIGSELLSIESIELEGQYYSMDFEGGIDLGQNEEEVVSVTFAPQEMGDYSGGILITSTDTDEGEIDISLSGRGVKALIRIEPEGIDFGNVYRNDTAFRNLDIYNDGNVALDISDILSSNEVFWYELNIEEREFDWDFDITDINMSLLILDYTLDEEILADEDFVGIFTPGGVCSGFMEVSAANYQGNLGFTAWGDEQGGDRNGFVDGEELEFRYWDASAGREYVADAEYHQGDGTFTANTLTVATLSADSRFAPQELDPHVFVEPESMISLSVFFGPPEQEDYEGILTISSNGFDAADVEIALNGAGVNPPPEVVEEIEVVNVNEDHGRYDIADLDEVFVDPDEDGMTFSVTDTPEPLRMDIDEDNVLYIDTDENYNLPDGTSVTLTADDGDGGSTDLEFNLVIVKVNDTPTITDDIDDVEVNEDPDRVDVADLDDIFADVDMNDAVEPDALSFSVAGGPDELNLDIDEDNVLFFIPSANFNLLDGADITVTATDNFESSVEDMFTITINPVNDVPEIANEIGDLEVAEDEGLRFIINLDDVFTDIDFVNDDALTYTFEGAPEEVRMGLFEENVLFIDADDNYNLVNGAEITVTATDNQNESVSDIFMLSITQVNDEPFVDNEIEDITIAEDAQEATVIGDLGEVFDDVDIYDAVDADWLDFSHDAPDELRMEISEENILSFHAVEDYYLADGMFITITAQDQYNRRIRDRFLLTITPSQAEIVVEPVELDFEDVMVQETTELSFTVSNIGSQVLSIDNIELDGQYYGIDFEGGVDLERYEEVDVTVSFTPEEMGDHVGSILVTSNDADVEVSLTGHGVMSVIRLEPESIEFGNVYRNETASRNLEVYNDGNIALDINDIVTNPEVFSYELNIEEREFDWDFEVTDINMSLLILEFTLGGDPLEDDDYVGVFTPGGICAGFRIAGEADNQGSLGFPVWGDEQGEEINGFRDGEELEFRYWDASASREFVAEADYMQGDGTFSANTMTVATLSTQNRFEPNELDPHVIIEPEGMVSITVYFEPPAEEEYDGVLTISSNAVDAPDAEVALNGIGINPPPEVAEEIGVVEVNEDAGRYDIRDLDEIFVDPDEDGLTFSITETPEGLGMDIDEDNVLYINTDENYNLPGGIGVTVTAQDEDGGSVDLEFSVVILPVNDTPTVEAPFDDVVTEEDHGRFDVAVLDEVFADVDMNDAVDPDALSFSVAGGPDELNLDIDEDNMLFFHSSEDFILPDGAEITVTAADNFEASVDHVFTITITPVNDGPVVENEIADTVVDEDAGLTIIVDLDDVFTDIDFDELSFTFEGAPDEFRMDIDDENNLFIESDENYNLVNGAEITVTAADADEESVSDSFTLIITPVNDEPFVVAENEIADITIEEDAPEATIIGDLDDVFDDVDIYDAEDADWLDFSHDAPDELNMEISEENVLSFHADEDYYIADGMFITITAQDQRNRRIRDRFELTITQLPPEISDIEVEHDFGQVMLNDAADWVFTIENFGSELLEIQEISIDGHYYFMDFEEQVNLGKREQLDVTVTFTPEELGVFDGQMVIISNDEDEGEIEITLTGNSIAAFVEADRDEIDFGEVEQRRDVTEELTLTNDGNIDLEIEEIQVSSEQFWVEVIEEEREFDWEFEVTDNNMSLLVTEATLNGEDLADEDYLGVFTPAGICAGYFQISEGDDGRWGFPAWGDEDGGDINGFRVNELIEFHFWDESAGRDIIPDVTVLGDGDGRYHSNTMQAFELSADNRFIPQDAELIIGANSSVILTVHFLPDDKIEYNETLTIISNALDNQEVVIGLHGIGTNLAPIVIGEIDPLTVQEDPGQVDVAILDEIFEDPDGNELEFSFEGAPDEINMEIDVESSALFFIPDDNYNLPDGALITLTASDPEGEEATFRFALTIEAVNDAPEVIQPIERFTIDEDAELTEIADMNQVFFDVDGDELSFDIVQGVEELNLIIDDESLLSVHPAPDYFGDSEVIISASDGYQEQRIIVNTRFSNNAAVQESNFANRNRSIRSTNGLGANDYQPIRDDVTEDAFTMEVVSINDIPTVEQVIDNIDIEEDHGLYVIADLDDVFEDIEDADLSFSISDVPEELRMTINDENILSFETVDNYNIPDGLDVTITATDSDEDSVDESFNLVINAVNDDPVWEEYPAEAINVDEAVRIEFDLIASDVDGDDIEIQFDPENLPGAATLTVIDNGHSYFEWQTNHRDAGEYHPTFTIDDGEIQHEIVVDINVANVNLRPYINDVNETNSFSLNEGTVLGFTVNAFEPDGERLTYSFDRDGLPDHALTTDEGDNSATLYWEINYDDAGDYTVGFEVSDGDLTANIDVEIAVINVDRLVHFPYPVPTEDNHSLVINDLTLDGEAVPRLWEIAVFTPEGLLSGAELWLVDPNEDRIGLAIWGDDRDTEELEGFRDGERMIFKAWDFETDIEYNANPVDVDGSLDWSADGITTLSLEVSFNRIQNIDFTRGWNLISLNILPGNEYFDEDEDRGPNVERMLAGLADGEGGHHLILIKNDRGRFYHPETGFSNIPYWDFQKGYSAKVDQDIRGTWEGLPIEDQEPIPMRGGWNIIPYFPDYELSARSPDFHVLSPIIDHVILAKNSRGRFMSPGARFSNMPNWYASQAYKVKVDEPIEGFQYPVEPDQDAQIGSVTIERTEHYTEPIFTDANMSVLITEIAGYDFKSDDQVAAYSTSGVIVGVSFVDDEGRCGLAVWGDDPTTENVDGLINREAFELRLWNSENQTEVNLVPAAIWEGNGLNYESEGFMMLKTALAPEIPDNFYLSDAYPNPFNSQTRITYGMPVEGKVSIKLYDLSGRYIVSLVNEQKTAGSHLVLIDAENLVSGVYVVRMESQNYRASKKVILVK